MLLDAWLRLNELLTGLTRDPLRAHYLRYPAARIPRLRYRATVRSTEQESWVLCLQFEDNDSVRRAQLNMADLRGGGVRGDGEAMVIVIASTWSSLSTARIAHTFFCRAPKLDGAIQRKLMPMRDVLCLWQIKKR